MQVEFRIDETCTEPKVLVLASGMTDEVARLLRRLTAEAPPALSGFREGEAALLEPSDIVRVHTSGGRVVAVTTRGEYQLRQRLYELEARLDPAFFVRISHSEIINLRRTKGFDLSLAGTIRVTMDNGDTAYVSRRYVAKIRGILGL